MRYSALILFIIIFVLSGKAFASQAQSSFDLANKFYNEQSFDSAVYYYNQVLHSGITNSTVFFNLGNAYYRLKQPGLARLYYEKASRLKPQDQDIAANIKFVSASIVDRVPEPDRGFLESILWQFHVLMPLGMQLWILVFMLFSISVLLSTALYTHRNSRLWLTYISALLSIATCIIGISAGLKIHDLEKISYAIVLSRSSDAVNQPDGKKILFTAHEGTKFLIRKIENDWSLVSLPNGISGWVRSSDIGKI